MYEYIELLFLQFTENLYMFVALLFLQQKKVDLLKNEGVTGYISSVNAML